MPLDQRLIFKARNGAMRRLARLHYAEFLRIYEDERAKLGLPPTRDQIVLFGPAAIIHHKEVHDQPQHQPSPS